MPKLCKHGLKQCIKLPFIYLSYISFQFEFVGFYTLFTQNRFPEIFSSLIFAMANIRRIGRDHQAPYQVVVVVLENQAVMQGEKNKLLHD